MERKCIAHFLDVHPLLLAPRQSSASHLAEHIASQARVTGKTESLEPGHAAAVLTQGAEFYFRGSLGPMFAL